MPGSRWGRAPEGVTVKSDDYRPQVGYTSWLLKRTERSVATLLYDRLRDLGLTPSQYGALQVLIRLGKASSAELARALFVTPQAMTGLVAGLERQGYITRKPLQSSRVIEATVTPLGQKVFHEATVRVEQIDALMTSLLSDREVATLRRALERCVDAIERSARGQLDLPDEPEPLELPEAERR
jgi:DNA-binding MarR family transcriptional regulator